MDIAERRSYFRLIYRNAFRALGVTLAASAIISGLYGGARLYFIYALSALGCVCICAAWFLHLGRKGVRPFSSLVSRRKTRVPYALRKEKDRRASRPSFRQDFTDFDDDLTDRTAVSEGSFTPAQAGAAKSLGLALCGAILIILSFVFLA